MNGDGRGGRPATARRCLVGLSVAFAVSFFVLAAARLNCPVALEWVEVALQDHVTRVLRGQALYVEPSLDFVPCIYTPLYYYVCALVSKMIGVAGFAPMRLVSLLSSSVVAVLVLRGVERETRDRLSAIVASGLFLASYGLVDFWLDLGRVDAFFVVLTSSCLYLLRFNRSHKSAVVAGLLGALAIQAKQAALVALAPVVVHQLLVGRARGRWFVGILVLITAAAVSLLDRGGWYRYYVFELPAQHPYANDRILMFWLFDFVPWFAPSLVLAGWTWRLPASSTSAGEREGRRLWLTAGSGLVATSWVSWFHAGAARNVFLPACLAASVMAGFVLASFQRRVREVPATQRESRETLGYACVIAQFALLLYNPLDALPRRDLANEQVVSTLPGEDVWIPARIQIDLNQSHPSHAHWAPLMDVLKGGDTAIRAALQRSSAEVVATGKFEAIILPEQCELVDGLVISEALHENYEWRPLSSEGGVWTPRARPPRAGRATPYGPVRLAADREIANVP